MKILLITPVHPKLEKKDPLPSYQTQKHWLNALKELGHQVTTFPLTRSSLKLINFIKVKKLISKQSFDHVFFSAGIDKIHPIKNTIFFCGVPPKTISSRERSTAFRAKLIVVNDPRHQKQWQKITKTKTINLPYSAIDPKIFKPKKGVKKHKLVFIGTLFDNRQLQLIKLVKQNIDIKIWGWLPPGIKLLPQLEAYYQGEAWGQKAVKIYQESSIALNLTPDHMTSGGNLRTFEIPATKSLQFIDKINQSYYQDGKEIIVFTSPTDLAKKLKFYLSYPKERERVAKAGYSKTIKDHTFKNRFKKLLKLI